LTTNNVTTVAGTLRIRTANSLISRRRYSITFLLSKAFRNSIAYLKQKIKQEPGNSGSVFVKY
ncbi:MAG: hypothetical protein IKM38_11275, partial [Christensenellaceae bacterium]|nr:hypothetical protein [Christensenellaceae bacterium]